MPTEVILPRVDMDMAEGRIAAWHVKNGERVRKGQVLFDIETDKAAMEVDAEADGVIAGISGDLDVPIPVGWTVAWLLADGELLPKPATAPTDATKADPPASGPAEHSGRPAAAAAITVALATEGKVAVVDTPRPAATTASAAAAPAATPMRLLRATPLARSRARAAGIDLHALTGSGPQGRIVGLDVVPSRPPAAAPPAADAAPLNLVWLARGSGTPFVWLHGFASEHASWRPLAGALGPLPVAAIDLPNHGKSPRQPVAGFGGIADAVRARLVAEGIGDCHLVGHSVGGGVALALAAALGARLRSLTLIAPVGLGPEINGGFIDGLLRANGEASLRGWLRELVHDPAWLSAAFVATAWQQLRQPDQRAALAAMAQALLPDGSQAEALADRLAPAALAAALPVKVIWGRNDRIVPARHARRLPGNVALHLLDGVGHVPQVEAVGLVAELLRQQHRAGG